MTATYLETADALWGIQMHPSIGIIDLKDDERGIVCSDDTMIPTNACLFTVPFEAIMSIASLSTSPLQRECLSYLLDTSPLREDDALALLLLHERYVVKSDSKWYQHIQMLPKQYYSIPNFSDDQMALIQGSNLYTLGMVWRRQLRDDYDELCSKQLMIQPTSSCSTLGDLCGSWLTYDSYLWALSTIFSRFISIDHDSLGLVRGMVPVVDMLNHSPTSQVGHVYNAHDGLFRVITQQPWMSNDEICLNYGHVSNERLLMLYGFSIPNNPYASVHIYAAMEMESSNGGETRVSVKREALHRMGIPTDASIPFEVDGCSIPTSLLVFLRIQHASPEESISVEALLIAGSKPLSSGAATLSTS